LLKVDKSAAAPGPESYFIGTVWNQFLHAANPGAPGFEIVAVFFEPGARNRPHTHTSEQFLYGLEGTGFVHIAGRDPVLIGPGEMAVIPAGVIHMHGATETGEFVHIAMRPGGAGSHWEFDELPEGWRRFCLP
jgi:quercetin dioxygenase-like cupin family protein